MKRIDILITHSAGIHPGLILWHDYLPSVKLLVLLSPVGIDKPNAYKPEWLLNLVPSFDRTESVRSLVRSSIEPIAQRIVKQFDHDTAYLLAYTYFNFKSDLVIQLNIYN